MSRKALHLKRSTHMSRDKRSGSENVDLSNSNIEDGMSKKPKDSLTRFVHGV
jgi:hypothetical protein